MVWLGDTPAAEEGVWEASEQSLIAEHPGDSAIKTELNDSPYEITCASPACKADLDTSGTVETADLNLIITHWGTDNATADINVDGIVDTADLNLLISYWGQSCD